MAAFRHQFQSLNIRPEVRFDGRLILVDDSAEHRLFNPSLEFMLRRYLECPESRSEAREWLRDTNPFSPFGFVALCEYLDLDANYVRSGLMRWMINVDNGWMPESTCIDKQSAERCSKYRTSSLVPLIVKGRPASPPVQDIAASTARKR